MISGWKNRHVPTNTLLSQPFTTKEGAEQFVAQVAPNSKEQYKAEAQKDS